MREDDTVVNFPTLTTAPLSNVSECVSALQRAQDRPPHLPGLVVMHGPSGYGKSTAAAYAANKLRAYYVEAKSTWTRKALLLAILREMGVQPARTLYEMADQVSEQLVLSRRPLIIDEFDYLVDKRATEIVKDLYEGSGAAIMIIGEEQLPHKLKAWEKVDGRVLRWVSARPVSLEDTELLARLYCKDIQIAPELLLRIHQIAKGSVRRVCVNLENIRREAGINGWREVDLAKWGTREFYTGELQRGARA